MIEPKNPYALKTESDLASSLYGYAITRGTKAQFLNECALRLSDYSFHLKRAKRNFFWIGFSAAFAFMGLCFWLASIVRGEM